MTLQYTARPALYSDGTTKAVVGDWVTIYVNGDPDHYDARIIAPITRVCGGYRYVLQYTGPVLEQADVLSVVVQTCCDAVASQAAADLAAGLATKAPLAHTHVSADVTDASSVPAVGKLAKWPSSGTFPPSSHSHPISGVVGLQTALDGKFDAGDATIVGESDKLVKTTTSGQVSLFPANVADEIPVLEVTHPASGTGISGSSSGGIGVKGSSTSGSAGVVGEAPEGYGGEFNGGLGGVKIEGSTLNITTHRTIAASNSTGTKGDICHDANYLYVCTDTDTWKRIPLTW